jgi:phosphonate transport system substrate-binding protein
MPNRFAPFDITRAVPRRAALSMIGSGIAALGASRPGNAQEISRGLSVGLTPVFLNNDLEVLAALKTYLEEATGYSVQLVLRRTYEEITTLLVSGQLDAAWICGYPYITFRDRLDLLAVPVWQGQPLYQSYIIAAPENSATSVSDLRGSVHAFSDPNSNSGYLVTAALLAEQGLRPERFFGRVFFTYGHRNVVRAVASGLAESGSVDGYVWEVMSKVEPMFTQATRILRKSELLGFPPIATPRGALARAEVRALQGAFVNMENGHTGRTVLRLLHLDRFALAQPELFDTIAAKAELVKSMG